MNSLTDRLIETMKNEFGDDRKRISHTLSVLEHAQEILREEGGVYRIDFPSAMIHDTGIQ